MNGQATQQVSLWLMVVVALVIGGLVGYYLGVKGVGKGSPEKSVVEEIGQGVEKPANPFEGTGYKNPFENVKVNPFAP